MADRLGRSSRDKQQGWLQCRPHTRLQRGGCPGAPARSPHPHFPGDKQRRTLFPFPRQEPLRAQIPPAPAPEEEPSWKRAGPPSPKACVSIRRTRRAVSPGPTGLSVFSQKGTGCRQNSFPNRGQALAAVAAAMLSGPRRVPAGTRILPEKAAVQAFFLVAVLQSETGEPLKRLFSLCLRVCLPSPGGIREKAEEPQGQFRKRCSTWIFRQRGHQIKGHIFLLDKIAKKFFYCIRYFLKTFVLLTLWVLMAVAASCVTLSNSNSLKFLSDYSILNPSRPMSPKKVCSYDGHRIKMNQHINNSRSHLLDRFKKKKKKR